MVDQELEQILLARRVSKRFPGVLALDEVDFDCKHGEVHGLIGENGAGKSTLMKILAGIYHPDEGEILFKEQRVETFTPNFALNLGISIIHQELSLLPYMTVAENIFLGREPRSRAGLVDFPRMAGETTALLSQLDPRIRPKTPIHRLAPAQRQLVEIAKALSYQPELIIMDEPTSSLAEHERQRLFEIIHHLKENRVTVVYITHRLEEVLELADRVTVLRDGRTIDTLPIQEVSRQSLIHMMVGRDIEVVAAPRQQAPGEVVMQVNRLTRTGAFENVSFQLRRNEILGVAGLIGSGRTEVARAIFGADAVDSGEVLVNGQPLRLLDPNRAIQQGLSLIPEDRKSQGLVLIHSIRENIVLPSLKKLGVFGFIRRSEEKQMVRKSIEQLDIQANNPEQQVTYLSGGNQQKVVLAKWLNAGPQVMIFDEPTRGIDVGAKSEIHRRIRELADAGKSILMISSELPEILNLSDRILVMSGGQVAGELDGSQASEAGILALAYQHVSNQRESLTNGRTAAAAAAPGVFSRIRNRFGSIDFSENIVFIILLILMLLGILGTDNFLTVPNFANLLRQMVIPMLLAIGQTLVILSGGIDLSVFSVVTLSSVYAAGMMLGMNERLLPVAMVCLGVGLLFGLVNAFVVIKLRVVAIIATLGVAVIGRGLALIYTREPIARIPPALYKVSTSQIGPWPTSTIFLLLIILLAFVLLYRTAYGRHLYAVGGDSVIARLSGIAVNRVRALSYLMCSFLAALTGLFLTSRMGSGDPATDQYMVKGIDSIAAVLLGGTMLGGGRGGLVGTMAGVLVLVILDNVFNQLGLRFWHQQIAKGIIIILAVVIYRQRGGGT